VTDHDIHDPLRDDNDLFQAFALQSLFYLIKSQNGSLYIGFFGITGHRYFCPLFPVDLDGQGDGALDQKIRLNLGPRLGCDQSLMSERRPAFLRKVRHHRMEQPHQDVTCFMQCPGES
jgi:hypothetical protein